jgi:hypothetical protein
LPLPYPRLVAEIATFRGGITEEGYRARELVCGFGALIGSRYKAERSLLEGRDEIVLWFDG